MALHPVEARPLELTMPPDLGLELCREFRDEMHAAIGSVCSKHVLMHGTMRTERRVAFTDVCLEVFAGAMLGKAANKLEGIVKLREMKAAIYEFAEKTAKELS